MPSLYSRIANFKLYLTLPHVRALFNYHVPFYVVSSVSLFLQVYSFIDAV